jgi:hypothetical protein
MEISDLLEDLAVPYVLEVTSTEHGGKWVRRAAFPELPGCAAESVSALEAVRKVDELRVRMIVDMRRRGERPPRPRPPLATDVAVWSADLDRLFPEVFDESCWQSNVE